MFIDGGREASVSSRTKKPGKGLAGALTLVVAITGAGVGATRTDAWAPFTDAVCLNSPLADWRFYTDDFCSIRRLKVDEVTGAIDRFIDRSSGEAWEKRTDNVEPIFFQTWKEDHRIELENTQWAERRGEISVATGSDSGLNVFQVTVRIFYGPHKEIGSGEVIDRQEFITITPGRHGDQPTITKISFGDRKPREIFRYSQLTFARITNTYTGAFRSPDTVTVGYTGFQANPGTHLRALCDLEVNGNWWSRTRVGWVDNSDLVTRDQGQLDIALCDNHHLGDALVAAMRQ